MDLKNFNLFIIIRFDAFTTLRCGLKEDFTVGCSPVLWNCPSETIVSHHIFYAWTRCRAMTGRFDSKGVIDCSRHLSYKNANRQGRGTSRLQVHRSSNLTQKPPKKSRNDHSDPAGDDHITSSDPIFFCRNKFQPDVRKVHTHEEEHCLH